MTNGTVKWFDAQKGYGFITYNETEEIFVHFTGIVSDGFKTLKENQVVSFEIKDALRGPQATNVTVID
ncbi:cold shock domain-containing protein [Vagococcus coleopterorum]|uniref:Cold shock domain-containing protein n=1 Tax=Vagococcus coleopterorum TaxID=2714946 RepID=A0A6G8ANH5_9ENTE|nr:cold shock domain-containing protein [Vagococcus coleopterorum]QIL46492.1 cold shock domain-containing protein [Vagococcus coleopterorum]